MTQSQTRIPLDSSEIVLFAEPQLTSAACRKLLTFYRAFQEKNLAYFLSIRERWHAQNPGQFFLAGALQGFELLLGLTDACRVDLFDQLLQARLVELLLVAWKVLVSYHRHLFGET